MKLTLYQIDAFTNKLFGGNPAAVVPLKKWLSKIQMQQLASENNLSETVFFIPSARKGVDYDIRWFTPGIEVNLCGHATLAAAFVIFSFIKRKKKSIVFSSMSGLLKTYQKKDRIEMDFPSWKPERITDYPSNLAAALGGVEIVGVYKHRDLLVELATEVEVKNCSPDFSLLKSFEQDIMITAPGNDCDFVSRFFAPVSGIDEDPVTGSAHSQLIPFWSEKLNKKKMKAKQLSARGGEIGCEQLNKKRVLLSGQCVFYLKGIFKI
ncbi:MAG: PhzF family phenazine biosynthesis protein [Chitinophagaceae bacterium]